MTKTYPTPTLEEWPAELAARFPLGTRVRASVDMGLGKLKDVTAVVIEHTPQNPRGECVIGEGPNGERPHWHSTFAKLQRVEAEIAPRPADTLAPEERVDLAALEGRIRAGWDHFVRVGEALLAIRDRRLYRAEHKTFGDYCEAVWGWSRQRAQQLIDAAATTQTLVSTVGVQPENERQARELKEAARIVEQLEPEMVVAVAGYLKTATGSDKPSTSQVRAAAEVAASIDAHGTVAHPDTGAEVPLHTLTGEQRAAALVENVTTGTYERLQRQQQHIQESLQANASTGRGGWTDWCMTYAQQHLTDDQELRIVVRRDEAGNPYAEAKVVDTGTHATVAFGDRAPYLKKAVLNLVEEVKG
ncbi:hypothetical protein [Deinococcus sp. S9]|uniref:hypothetical protein n=1 Tax=Deinococcus sp. S9 TaxID=2545754 RepID=UPI0010554911|nr:hypothetical protein [Deinococcus sp. S9]TDE85313.1 hypothetical protein E0686_12325 [Deinococcus sp. S9]